MYRISIKFGETNIILAIHLKIVKFKFGDLLEISSFRNFNLTKCGEIIIWQNVHCPNLNDSDAFRTIKVCCTTLV